MNKCLVFFTSSFPFGGSETFIECELKYHTENFSDIFILALESDPGAKITANVDKNIRCLNVARRKKAFARFGDTFRGLLKCFQKTDAYLSDKDRLSGSFVKRVFLEYFEQRSRRQAKEALNALRDVDFSHYDEVVLYSYWFFAPARTAMLLKDSINNKNIRLVSRAHGYDTYMYANSLDYLPLRTAMLSAFDRLYVCSLDGRDYLRENFPEYKEKIDASYLGTIDNGYNETSDRSVFKIVSCSRAVALKRINRIVGALALLDGCDHQIEWTHIGSGPEIKKIKALAEASLKNIRFSFTGSIPNSEVLSFYSREKTNLIINVSEREGLPVSIMEAMSFGIPCIATDVGGTSEAVKDGVTGLLIDKNFSDKELSEKILAFINMEESDYRTLCKNSRARWEKYFDAQKNHKSFSKQISSL